MQSRRRYRHPTLRGLGFAALAAVGVGALFGQPASAYGPKEADLARLFERVCVNDLPGFEAVPDNLQSIGFRVIETVPGVFEADSRRSVYRIFVTPAQPGELFASCALSAPRLRFYEVVDALIDVLDGRFDADWRQMPDDGGIVRFRVFDHDGDLMFSVIPEKGGVGLTVERAPAEAEE